jgi:FixJ family two-component response regulator
VIFISGHADIEMAVDAMRGGAVDFLQKPFREQQLLDSVQRALAIDRSSRAVHEQREQIAARMASLTPREAEVYQCLLRGLRAKEIGAELGIATKTAEDHRAHVMHKMHATSIATLIALSTAPQ